MRFVWIILVGVFFISVSQLRLVAGDEAFYTLAIRLVSEGKSPYYDFFYPQSPFFPFLYSLFRVKGWILSRALSGVFATLTVLIVALRLGYDQKNSLASGKRLSLIFGCGLVLCCSPIFFPWVTLIEPYAISALLVTSIVLLVDLRSRFKSKDSYLIYNYIIAILFAAAVCVRLYLIILIIPLLLYTSKSLRLRVLVGTAVFTALLFLISTNFTIDFNKLDLIWFNNLGYHLNRTNSDLSFALKSKLKLITAITGITPSVKFAGFSTPLLVVLGLISSFLVFKKHCVIALSTILMTFICLVPTPSYLQYFAIPAPLLTLCFGLALKDFKNSTIKNIILITVVLSALSELPVNLLNYTFTGEGVMGISKQSDPQNFSVASTLKVSNLLDRHFKGLQVYSNWNGYFFDSQTNPIKGTENIFGMNVASSSKISTETKSRLKIISNQELKKLISKRKIDGLVLRTAFINSHKAIYKLLLKSNYNEIENTLGVKMFKKFN